MFVIFHNVNDYMTHLFDKYKNSKVIIDKIFHPPLSYINYAHNSYSINIKKQLPLKKIWYPFYLNYSKLDEIYKKGEPIYFVFFEGCKLFWQKPFLIYLRERYPGCKLIFRFVNVVSEIHNTCLDQIIHDFDLIISMEKKDCELYGWIYVPNTYWSKSLETSSKYDSDVLFLGVDKGRHDCLVNIYKCLTNKGLRCEFYVSGVPKEKQVAGIHYIHRMKYRDYLLRITKTRCILEILAKGQTGSSLRAIESVFFDKNLLTNNVSLIDEELFDPNYMYVFDNEQVLTDFSIPNKQPEYSDKKMLISHDRLFKAIEDYFEKPNKVK